jgi:hypothetical protein
MNPLLLGMRSRKHWPLDRDAQNCKAKGKKKSKRQKKKEALAA